ncbi:glycosyltransferase [Granulosicoccus sp.]|nr:glycosyltransferase [Granulosicoccus sp.]MDB4224442.1 glycosyltransferase [Granulosicoccus sp.]
MNVEKYSCIKPPLSIGVVTHDRALAFSKLLRYLIPAIEQYAHRCEVIVANNSGPSAHDHIESLVNESGLRDICACTVIDSSENNISTGRNIVLRHAQEDHLVFVDDDEYPVPTWLVALAIAMHKYDCKLVAGPILPIFPTDAPQWVRSIDLHNTHGLSSGDRIDYAASGNFLVNRKGVEDVRFGEFFGKSGGEDTEFFLQLKDKGHSLHWCTEAIVYEDIPPSKSTARYMIHRFMTQGRNYRVIMERRGEMGNVWWFTLRAAVLAFICIGIAKTLLYVRPVSAAKWMKRGYSNLGKIIQPDCHLYE